MELKFVVFLKYYLLVIFIWLCLFIVFQIIFSLLFNVQFYLFGYCVYIDDRKHFYSTGIEYEVIELLSFLCSFICVILFCNIIHICKRLKNEK